MVMKIQLAPEQDIVVHGYAKRIGEKMRDKAERLPAKTTGSPRI